VAGASIIRKWLLWVLLRALSLVTVPRYAQVLVGTLVTATNMKIRLILHNIRSAENVGSLFRTADAAGVEEISLVGYTPHPEDRFGRVNQKIKKTSLGATEFVPFHTYETIDECLEHLRKDGFYVVAIEQHARAVPYTDISYPEKVAFILGNEIEGVPPHVCEHADAVVYIRMHGKKESLNVGVAGGIVLFDALRNKR
jgi:23S rRNA (guanosine2251-2'-O)-methyltransferase